MGRGKFAGNGVEVIGVFKAVDNSRGGARKIQNGVFFAPPEGAPRRAR
jgi:hypothetical protein